MDEIEGRDEPPGCASCAGAFLLFIFAVGVGFGTPIFIVYYTSSRAEGPAWGAAICFLIAALIAEWLFSNRLRWWIRPFVWGLAIGGFFALISMISDGWN